MAVVISSEMVTRMSLVISSGMVVSKYPSYRFTPSSVADKSSNTQRDVQLAIFGYLSSVLTNPIYDNVPQNTNFPYYAIGVPINTGIETDLKSGLNILLPIHTWSEQHGRKETIELQAELYAALHRAKLEINGYNCISIVQENETILLDPDGVTRHGIQQFRILIINSEA